jgi:Fe-S-cluster containining protein
MAAQELSRWYSGLDLPCPFLTDGTCAIYPFRPLACREHLAAGETIEAPATSACPAAGQVHPPTSVLEALAALTADLEGLPLESVMLPLATHWAQANRHCSRRTYPARKVLNRFAEVLLRQARKYRSAAAA